MDWLEIAVNCDYEAQEAVANVLHEVTGSGVVIEDPGLVEQYKESGKWDAWDIPEASLRVGRVLIKGYIPQSDTLPGRVEDLRSRLAQLVWDFDCAISEPQFRDVREEDWATSWKAYFKPVHVSDHIVIKPTWEDYIPRQDEVIIELDPGMAFGTGTHATTGMCLQALEKYVLRGQRVLDVGTGSGILAVAAAKLGASEVMAVDNDETAVRVAAENAAQNGVQDKVSVLTGNLMQGVEGPYDIVLANIIADIIIKLAPNVPDVLKAGGIFIASGIIDERWPEVQVVLTDNRLTIEEVLTEGGWVCAVTRLRL